MKQFCSQLEELLNDKQGLGVIRELYPLLPLSYPFPYIPSQNNPTYHLMALGMDDEWAIHYCPFCGEKLDSASKP